MADKRPTGVLMVLVNNKATDREEDFNKWYNDIHLGEVCGTGSYYAAKRFVNTKPVLDPGEARYLAIYETDWDDPEAAFAHMRTKSPQMNVWPHIEAIQVKTFKFVSEHKVASAAPAKAPAAKKAKRKIVKAKPAKKAKRTIVKARAAKPKRSKARAKRR